MLVTYYPKYRILKALTKEESIEGTTLLNTPAPKKSSAYVVVTKVLKQLHKEQLIECDKEPDYNNVVSMRFSITAKGLEALKKRTEKLLFFWIPFVVTNAISIAALIVAIAT